MATYWLPKNILVPFLLLVVQAFSPLLKTAKTLRPVHVFSIVSSGMAFD